MYRKLNDFIDDWAYESSSTQKIFDNLTDEALPQKVTSDGRDLGFIAWHLAVTIPELMERTGLKVEGPEEHSQPPSSAAEISAAYKKASDSLVEQLKANWNDSMLEEEDDMY